LLQKFTKKLLKIFLKKVLKINLKNLKKILDPFWLSCLIAVSLEGWGVGSRGGGSKAGVGHRGNWLGLRLGLGLGLGLVWG